MVRLIIFMTFVLMPLFSQDVIVEAVINQNQAVVDHPIKGTITITHGRDQPVKNNSFKIKGNPLNTSLVKEVNIGEGKTIVSVYGFELPAAQKGLYVLSPISVTVGEKEYHSLPGSYEVKPAAGMSRLSEPAKGAQPFLHLEAFVKGPSPLYPGQRAKLVYRISYNRSTELSSSQLPLIHTTDFKKVGDEQVTDYEENGITYQDIIQEIETAKPGTYHYGPSVIEGYAYYYNKLGQKIYFDQLLHAETPEMDVVVNSFPPKDQPESFNGMIGKIDAKLIMKTGSEIKFGDEIELELSITGIVNLADVVLPPLLCQPVFSGFFHLNEMPPTAKIEGDVKNFQITLRPISYLLHAIPSIELSSFNPETADYSVWKSESIPLKVLPTAKADFPPNEFTLANMQTIQTIIEKANKPLPPIDSFQVVHVQPFDLSSSIIRTPFVLFLIPLGVWLLIFEVKRHRQGSRQRAFKAYKSGQDVLKDALQSNKISLAAALFQQALQMLLKEGKPIDENAAYAFLDKLDRLQYGGKQDERINLSKLQDEAKKIFYS